MKKIPLVRIDRAVEHYGGRTPFARFLGIAPQAISNWRKLGKIYLPDVRAFQVVADEPNLEEQPTKKRFK